MNSNEILPLAEGFGPFCLNEAITRALDDLGFTAPTLVQKMVVAKAIAGVDLMVQSRTGSGKTAAFAIPLLMRMATTPSSTQNNRPRAVVVLPTRELAQQVAEQLCKLGRYQSTRTVLLYGGVSLHAQEQLLRKGAEVVVGTPGRILDHLRRGNLQLDAVQTVVLDEADEMLSMGFWNDVVHILQSTPKKRQTMLFSATLSPQVAQKSQSLMHKPERIDVSGSDLTVSLIENWVVHLKNDMSKPRQLLALLETMNMEGAIVFCNRRFEAEMVAKYLSNHGFVAEALTGSMRQKEREHIIRRIKTNRLRFMVATDVAARGIDIQNLAFVVNYSLPDSAEVYLHRVGRTGRQGQTGVALSLVDTQSLGTLSQLKRNFGIVFKEMILPPDAEISLAKGKRIMKELLEKAAMAEISQHLAVAQDIVQNEKASAIVAYLLKVYFAEQTPKKSGGGVARSEPPVGNGSEPTGSLRRRRRRRKGSSTAGGVATNRTASSQPSGATRTREALPSKPWRAAVHKNGYEIVDAEDLLSDHLPTASVLPVLASHGSEAMEMVVSPTGNKLKLWVNIGFDDGFKGRGQVAKKIAALAGLNEGIIVEVEARRDHAILAASSEIVELVLDRVDGAALGKKLIEVQKYDSA